MFKHVFTFTMLPVFVAGIMILAAVLGGASFKQPRVAEVTMKFSVAQAQRLCDETKAINEMFLVETPEINSFCERTFHAR